MPSFGLEPFDDDDTQDWLESLTPGDFDALAARLNSTTRGEERLRWGASGLLASLYDTSFDVPPTLHVWRTASAAPWPDLLEAARATANEALDSVTAYIAENPDSSDRFAPQAWQAVVAALSGDRPL
ncbi:MAG: hypothetical protein AAFX85_11875, partial [Pseudomonadota bacterium]